jgi:hypothetical protein
MAEHPWRCSQCGTINEPVANSCRTCGKWPSLFDLEDNVVEEIDFESAADEETVATYAPPPEPQRAPEPAPVEVPTFEEPTFEEAAPETSPRKRFGPPKTEPVFEEGEASRPRWVSWLIPAAFVVYILISYAFSAR